VPIKPQKSCRVAGCPEVSVSHGRCQKHVKQRERERGSAAARGYDREWRRIRAEYLVTHPICEVCKKVPATEVHHKNPLAPRGTGTHDWWNLEARCKPCHSRRTMMEFVG
jgi:5-methylcytosine-specific restriction protein A